MPKAFEIDFKKLVKELCKQDKSYKEIGTQFGITDKQLSTYVMVMRRKGVKIPSRQRRFSQRFVVEELNKIIEENT